MWSTEPAHEPLNPKWKYDEINARCAAKRGSRDGDGFNTHPDPRRTYVLRGMILDECGLRMFGTHRHKSAYYLCWPRNNNRGRPDKYAGHAKAVYIREDAVLDAVSRFFADRVSGPDRRAILAADIEGIDDRATPERFQRSPADIAKRQNSLLRQARNGDPDDPFAKALRGSCNELDAKKTTALAAISQLDITDEAEPRHPEQADLTLFDALPHLALTPADAPEPLLRKLFEITQLSVRLHDDTDDVTIGIRLPADQLPAIAQTAERAAEIVAADAQLPVTSVVTGNCVDAVRAPGQSRTDTGRILSPSPSRAPVHTAGRTSHRLTRSNIRGCQTSEFMDRFMDGHSQEALRLGAETGG